MTLNVKAWIKSYEGLRLFPYLDTTGNVTIGYGRNLDDGITQMEADVLFQNDFNRCVSELEHFSWYLEAPETVKNALINMNFNLGLHKLIEFKNMIMALEQKNYRKAAQEVLNSEWASKVGQRAKDVAVMIGG